MKRTTTFISIILTVCLMLGACGKKADEQSAVDREVINQVSLLQGLTLGDYNGSITAAQLKEKGDIGIGTFDALNGELIMLDGVIYRAASDGTIEVVSDDETIPFSNVTFFDDEQIFDISGIENVGALKDTLNKKVDELGSNQFYFVKINGTFKEMNVRSEYAQSKPYKPLATVLETDQTFFDYENISGTVVGLYCPEYMNDLNAVGWHFHFISDDRTKGGHVLELMTDAAEVRMDSTSSFAMILPDNDMFDGFDLTVDQSADIKKVETGDDSASDESNIVSFEEKKKEMENSDFEYWDSSSPALNSIIEFVEKSVDESSEGFIPEKDRIAVFDMDGTLTCETFYTYYDTMMFINYCLVDHPDEVSDELKAAAEEIKPGYTAGEELARNFAKAYAGMTVSELYDYAVEFGQKQTDSFVNMRYIDGFYLPMVEVVKYLYENGFTIYVVSGTERTTTRAIIANSPISDYVSPSHVIGTEFEVKVKGYEDVSSNMDYKYADGDELVITGEFIQKNLNANKTIWIEREIGQYPVLAFGNSGSDTSMMNYALDKRNPYPSEAYMIVADDDVREWGSQNWEEKSAQYKEQGYVPISMKNDFLEIYPDTIKRSDVQYIESDDEELKAG